MPNLYLLVGVPGSGKSTWTNQFLSELDAVVIDTDSLIEKWAADRGMNYSQAFSHKEFRFKDVQRQMEREFEAAVIARKNIIVDRTNLNKKSRGSFLHKATDDYDTYAVVFELERDLLNTRLDHRASTTGKRIPASVVDDMIKNYEPPTLDEFDNIMRV